MTEPQLVLGAMLFGTRIPERDSFTLLDRFVEQGGVWIDTANCYTFWLSDSGFGGQSETVLGNWLAARPGMRDRVRIATKVGAEPLIAGAWPSSAEGLAPAVIHSGLAGSLERLRTDRVDLLWAHKEDRATAIEVAAEAMAAEVMAGAALRIGASNHPAWRVERACAHARQLGLPMFDSLQLRESYLHPRPDAPVPGEDHPFGMLTLDGRDYAIDAGLEVWAYTSLLGGSYDREDRPFADVYHHPGTTVRLAALTRVATELDVPRSQVVLAWLVGGSPSITPILGGSTIPQLDSALAGARLVLSSEHRAILDAAGTGAGSLTQ
jgi:aryl-alcohol dehydrogenase-like predicted oxidoreductase